MLPISVVLPVYHRIDPEQFGAALESLRTQTQPATEIVIVADGPLTPGLDAVIEAFDPSPTRLDVVRLAENGGTAVAMQAGVDAVTQPWIARQDADDLSLPRRFEICAPYTASDRYDLIGGAMYEFEGTPDNVLGIRRMPEDLDAIRRAVRSNNPINNPTIMLRRSAIDAVGGIREVYLMEDYDLVARMLAAGSGAINLQEPLVLFRTDGMFTRRRGARVAQAERQMQSTLHELGLVSRPRMLLNIAVRTAARRLPSGVFEWLYKRVFRRGVTAPPAATTQERGETPDGGATR
ncbi:glycosyltransferase involved in cell wall biosynthesis [Pseudoclavibacter chungangensis]|uniref:glycosyltransferase n=1 Tax=Pseudoclavibacter chungangensis TaxID=587635 RepID=UPI0015CBFB68|nr:glycosyltransferase [Pseudoclavibacter chungangensis]NYJ67663.1 glycosyltransferase involved in cell wall biosynthesis [Pseudoclavibacter chungangensis]